MRSLGVPNSGLLIATIFGLIACLVSTTTTAAETFPSKPLTIVVPTGAGGGTDAIARQMQDVLSKNLRHTVVIKNHAGGAQRTGTAFVAKSEPDGYTILITGTTALSVSPAIFGDKLEYSVLDDFEPLGLLYTSPNLFTVHPSLPAKTLQEFVDLVKKNPGKFNYASAGIGSFYHLGTEAFSLKAGRLNIAHIPYKDGHGALVATLANEVQFSMNGLAATLPHVAAGKLRVLATTGNKRQQALPEVPTLSEAGFPGLILTAHVVAVVPKKTPKERVDFLRNAFKQANSSKAVRDFYEKISAVPHDVDRDEYIEYHKQDVKNFSDAAKAVGLYQGTK